MLRRSSWSVECNRWSYTILVSVILVLAVFLLASPSQVLIADDSSFIRDLSIEQRPMAQLPEPSQQQSGGLKVTAWVDKENNTYGVGDSLTLFFKVNQDAYVTIMDTGTSGKVHVIFPNQFIPDNRVSAGQVVSIPGPDADYEYRVNEPAGPELITVIATKNEKPILAGYTTVSGTGPIFKELDKPASALVKDLQVVLKDEHESESAAASVDSKGWAQYQKVFYVK